MMEAKLMPPVMDKHWSLHFIDVPFNIEDSRSLLDNPEKGNIWRWAQYYGKHYHTNPFLQGNCKGWMMIEFWTQDEAAILECCEDICKAVNVELQIK